MQGEHDLTGFVTALLCVGAVRLSTSSVSITAMPSSVLRNKDKKEGENELRKAAEREERLFSCLHG